MDIQAMKAQHQTLAQYQYQTAAIEKGYTNRTLYVNVGDNTIKEKPVTQKMKDIFVGGKGFGLWYLWNAVTPQTRWNDPENEIIVRSPPKPAGMIRRMKSLSALARWPGSPSIRVPGNPWWWLCLP